MRNIHKRKVSVFGKKVPVLVLVGVFALAIATAALLPYFGQITGSATAEQGLLVDGESMDDSEDLETTWDGSEFTSLEAKTFVSAHDLTNNADVDAEVTLGQHEDDGCSGAGSCDEINVSYYNYSEKKFPLKVAGDEESEDFGELYVTANPKEDRVVYKAEVPEDYFEGSAANLNFQVSPTDSEDEDNFQVKYHPEKDDYDWKFLTPSSSQDDVETGKDNVEARDEVISVKYIDNEDGPGVVKVVLNKPEAQQSFLVHASDGGERYQTMATTEDFEYNDESTDGHKLVAEELTDPVKVPAEDSVDFAIVTDFPQMTYPGTYDITTTVDMAE